MSDFADWAAECHAKRNHFYDSDLNLPYQFHLTMAVMVGEQFKHLLPTGIWSDGSTRPYEGAHSVDAKYYWSWNQIVKPAIWGHDLIEDTGENYNSVLKMSNFYVAEIIRAVTNYGRGRNRQERMPDYIYMEIVDTRFVVFVKLCDRIANVRYSIMMQSRMLDVYRSEHAHFEKVLRFDLTLQPMWDLLNDLLK